MKIKPLLIALGSVALVGVSCTSAFLSYAQTDDDNTTSMTEVDIADKGYSIENLPYYETEKTDEEVVVESVTINKNGNFYFLDND